jgi:hypothetical protein
MSWAIDMGFDGYPDLVDIPSNDADDIWVTKDNQKVRIGKMTDEHLYFAYRKFNDDRLAREMLLRLFKKGIKND